jgi:hypothetical protein
MATLMQTQQKRELVQTMLGWLMLAPPARRDAVSPSSARRRVRKGVKLDVIDGKSAEWPGLVRLYIQPGGSSPVRSEL